MFSERLRNTRELHGLSQEDVANKLGLATSTYSMYEQGRRQPKLDSLIALADLFGVTTDYLLEREDTQNRNETEIDILINELTNSKDIQKILKVLVQLDNFDRGQVFLTAKNLLDSNDNKKGVDYA